RARPAGRPDGGAGPLPQSRAPPPAGPLNQRRTDFALRFLVPGSWFLVPGYETRGTRNKEPGTCSAFSLDHLGQHEVVRYVVGIEPPLFGIVASAELVVDQVLQHDDAGRLVGVSMGHARRDVQPAVWCEDNLGAKT